MSYQRHAALAFRLYLAVVVNSLLPPNSTPLELALEQLIQELFNFTMNLSDVNNADKCPAKFLPWLAWSRSVDAWDNAWTDAQKRSVIKASFSVHKAKGSIGAVRAAVNSLGYRSKISEWFQHNGAPYTFSVTVYINDRPIDAAAQASMVDVITQAKKGSSGFQLNLATEARSAIRVASAVMTSRTVRVGPWQPTESNAAGQLQVAAALVTHKTVRVTPR